MPVYDTALAPGWQNWSWAKADLSVELTGQRPQTHPRRGGSLPGALPASRPVQHDGHDETLAADPGLGTGRGSAHLRAHRRQGRSAKANTSSSAIRAGRRSSCRWPRSASRTRPSTASGCRTPRRRPAEVLRHRDQDPLTPGAASTYALAARGPDNRATRNSAGWTLR